MNTQISKGIFDLVILLMLSNKEMYGYEITKQLRNIDALNIADGSIYPILQRLKAKGLIKTTRKIYEGRVRIYYYCSKEGKKFAQEQYELLTELYKFIESIKKEDADEHNKLYR